MFVIVVLGDVFTDDSAQRRRHALYHAFTWVITISSVVYLTVSDAWGPSGVPDTEIYAWSVTNAWHFVGVALRQIHV